MGNQSSAGCLSGNSAREVIAEHLSFTFAAKV